MNSKRDLLATVVACFFASIAISPLITKATAQSLPVPMAPSGWSKKNVNGKRPNVSFTKKGLSSPDYLAVKYYERDVLVDEGLSEWISKRLATGKAPLKGIWTSPIQNLTRQTANLYTGERRFRVEGEEHLITMVAVCYDKMNVRSAALIKSMTAKAKKYDREANRLLGEISLLEINAAKKDGRPLSIENSPPKVKGLKQGGPIKPGRYIGVTKKKKDNKAGVRHDLVIFANGEYEFLGRKRNSTGVFEYSAATGRLQIDEPLVNHYRDWQDEFCVFGKNRKNEHLIHAETSYQLTVLKWIENSDRVAPSEEAQQEALAKAEAARYKHVTSPGDGVMPEEIESVMYTWQSVFRNGAAQVDYEGYLLLKDGRVLDGLPCSPDTLDLAASRSRAPDSWGWWKKVKGDKKNRYSFAWPVREREYKMPKGAQVIGVPFKKGTRLSGDFGAASTRVNLAVNYSSVRWWGIKFSENGRFLKYRNGSTQSSLAGDPGGLNSGLVTSVWDDEGAVTAFSSSAVVGSSKRKSSHPASDRMGTYELDGYRLTLKFDSGRIEHHGSFTDNKQSSIWFEGHSLGLKKGKKK